MKVYFNVCTVCSSAKEQQERNLSLIKEISSLGNNISLDIAFLTLNSVIK